MRAEASRAATPLVGLQGRDAAGDDRGDEELSDRRLRKKGEQDQRTRGRDQRAEIAGSKQRLEAITGQPIRRLAYPFGDYDERSMTIARDLGFDYAVSVEAGPVGDSAARFRLPRHDIKNWTGEEFARRLRWRI